MTAHRLICCSLLGLLLGSLGAALAASPPPSQAPKSPVPRRLEPAPWWWAGPKGDVYYAVVAKVKHQAPGLHLPPTVKPVDPPGLAPSRTSDASTGNPGASKASLSSFATPGTASIANGTGSLALSTRASSAPARPDAREVRRELEGARRALGL